MTPYAQAFFAEFRPSTAKDMIDRVPGFTFNGGSSARGFAGTAGNVLVDGQRPPSRGDSLSDVLGRIPASTVERIEIVRGGAPGVDMQGHAIIANVIRKPGAGLTGSAQADVNADTYGNLDRNLLVQAQKQFLDSRLEGSLRYYKDESGSTEYRDRRAILPSATNEVAVNNGWGRYEIVETAGSYETDILGGNLRLNGQASTRNSGDNDFERLTLPLSQYSAGSLGDRDAGELGLRFSRAIGDFDAEVIGFHSRYWSEDQSSSSRRAFTSVSEGEGGESIGSLAVGSPDYGPWSFDAGSELAFNFQESATLRTVNGIPLPLTGDSNRVEELRSDMRLIATWAPTSAFNMETGLRYERSTISAGTTEKTLSYIKPRLNLSWSPKTGHQYGLRIERIVDQLPFNDFLSSADVNSSPGEVIVGIGNNELEPSHYWLLDLRYERRWAREGVFVAQVNHRRVDDFISRAIVTQQAQPANPGDPLPPPTRVEMPRNVGEAVRTVYSVSTTVPLDAYGLTGGLFEVGLNVRTSETRDAVDTDLIRRVNGDEPFGWNVKLSRNVEALNFDWALSASGGDAATSYSPRSIRTYDNEFSLSASFNWRPRPDLSVRGGVSNILAGDDLDTVTFYDAYRDVGSPQYFESTFEPGAQSVYVILRKSFS